MKLNASVRLISPLLMSFLMLALLSGCRTSGIRALEAAERDYYVKLNAELKSSTGVIDETLRASSAGTANAREEIARFNGAIRAAATVYDVREVLTAPAGDSQPFVQNTRNSVLMYTLARQSIADAAAFDEQLAADARERRELVGATSRLAALSAAVVDTEMQLHAYLNQPASATMIDSLREVHRQLTAFNTEAASGDQANAAVAKATELSKTGADAAQTSATGMEKFIELWAKLNEKGK